MSAGDMLAPLTARMPLADSPSWSPGDAWIAFAGSTPNFVQQIYVVPARGAGARRLTSLRGGAARPAWSPDGRLIIFAGKASGAAHQRPDLWVIRPDGSGLRRLIADGTDPAWSPDGRTIVFVRGTQIYLAAANGTHQRQLTATLTEKETPSWAPSGSSIVFGDGDPAEGEALDEVRAGAAAADSQQLQNITASVHGLWAAAPAWQPAVP
jgi:Tol biopolymer transport system component